MSPAPAKPDLRQRVAVLRGQIAGMEAKRQRLAVAVDQRQKQLTRLEAAVAMSGRTPPARPSHE